MGDESRAPIQRERSGFYDWRDGVDIDAEMSDWYRAARRGKVIVAVGCAIAVAWSIVVTITDTPDGVRYMAGAAFFLALLFVGFTWFGRRRT